MTARLRPTDFVVVDCTPSCSLNPRTNKIADAIHEAYCQGYNDREISALSDRLNHHLSIGAIGRHRARHLVRRDAAAVVMMAKDDGGPVDHVKVLEMMIARGAKISHTWRMGPAETLKAMEMHYKLTEGRREDALMDALTEAAAAMRASTEGASEEEQAQGGDGE